MTGLLRPRPFPFRKRSLPFLRHLEILPTINEFFSTKLEKKKSYKSRPGIEPRTFRMLTIHHEVDPASTIYEREISSAGGDADW